MLFVKAQRKSATGKKLKVRVCFITNDLTYSLRSVYQRLLSLTNSLHIHIRFTVEPPNNGHFGANNFVPYREVVPILEVK